jgi:hypothetical protein
MEAHFSPSHYKKIIIGVVIFLNEAIGIDNVWPLVHE